MKTLQDARRCMSGLGWAVVSSLPEKVKAPFFAKAEELGRQIAADNGMPFEAMDLPRETILSPTAEQLLVELTELKQRIFLQSRH